MLSHMKRTTLVLDAALYAELKKRAASEGRTLTDVVERALRLGLAARPAVRRARVGLPSYDLGPFLMNPADADAVAGLRRAATLHEEE
jgi:ribbon-helix-helix CopG family protein